MNKNRIKEIVAIILSLGVLRLAMTYPPNFNPIGAMALFGGAVLASKRLAYIIPLAALFITDIAIALIRPGGFDYLLMRHDASMIFGYIAFAAAVYIGYRYLQSGRTYKKVFGAAFGFSVIFFILSNFGAWLMSPLYPQTAEGLMACYAAGLAFFQGDALQNFALNTLVSTTAFSFIAFYAYDYVTKSADAKEKLVA